MAFDVFISYSTKDKTVADASCAALERAGIRCWIAPRDIIPGMEWDEAIVRAIDNCRVVLLIFSASANDSRQIRREVKRAFNRGAPVVPLRIEAIVPTETMAYYMDSVHWLDALTPPLEEHLARLVEIVKAFLNTDAGVRPIQSALGEFLQGDATEEIRPTSSNGSSRRPTVDATQAAQAGAPSFGAGVTKRTLLALGTASVAAAGIGTIGFLGLRNNAPVVVPRDLPPSGGQSQSGGSPVRASLKSVALVVGNASYRNVPALRTPTADATAISEIFKSAGFQTMSLLDGASVDLKRALRGFRDAASDADLAVFYYAGHGIEISGTNYLIPVDARLANQYDADDEAVSLERVVMAVEPARRLRLLILDACRDNPFEKSMVRTRSLARGLAPVELATGSTLIAYAAKAGTTASDGEGPHSPYTTALLKHLPTPDLDIRIVFGKVRDDVLQATRNRQEPFVYGSMGGDVISLVSNRTATR